MKIVLLVNGDLGVIFARSINKVADIELSITDTFLSACKLQNYSKSIIYQNNIDFEYKIFDNYSFDCIISFNWNYRLPNDICNKYECYNIHYSILPKHRGPIPLVFTILEEEMYTGVTLHKMSVMFDEGDIFDSEIFRLTSYMDYTKLNLMCMKAAIKLFYKFCKAYPNIVCHKQNDVNSSYEGIVDLDKYIVTSETSFIQLQKIIRAFDNRIPVKIIVDNKTEVLISYTFESNENCNIRYNLKDKTIYIKLSK